MFDFTCYLCERFPSLNPLTIRNTKADEIFKLRDKLRAKEKPRKKPRKKVYADEVNWF